MSLEIKVIATKTYTKSKHFLSVMIFVNLWNLTFASELSHLFHYSLYVLMSAEKHCMSMYSYWGGKVIELFLIKKKMSQAEVSFKWEAEQYWYVSREINEAEHKYWLANNLLLV